MTAALRNVCRWTLLQVPTVVVLAALGGIGYVGYATDWTVPKFSALWTPEEPKTDEPVIKLVPNKELHQHADPCMREFQKLEIRFPDAEWIAKAGLQFAPVATRSMAQYVTATGTVNYNQNQIAHLSSPVQGNTKRVEKHLGDRVKKGDVLALVQSADVGRAKADFKSYLVQVKTLERRFASIEAHADSVSPADRLNVRAALDLAKINLFNAQQALLNLGLPVRIDEMKQFSEQDVAERVATLGLDAVRNHSALGSTIENLIPLTAPFDGEVVDRDIVEGEVVGPTKPVQFTVADLSTMWILLDVREEDREAVRQDQPVVFHVDGTAKQPVAGKVNWISPEMDPKTRTLRVRVEVENPERRLLVRSFGTGRILVRSLADTLAVPDNAIQHKDDCRMVFVRLVDGKSFQTRLVKLGIHSDGHTQILEGVAAGEEVVTVGSHALKAEILRNLIAGDD
jgi:cobalt-zinc-cadmium efflux system membrane fusion protein